MWCYKEVRLLEWLDHEDGTLSWVGLVPYKTGALALARWTIWLECCLVYGKILGSIPHRCTYLGSGFVLGHLQEEADLCFSHQSFSPLSLKSIDMLSGEDFKKRGALIKAIMFFLMFPFSQAIVPSYSIRH